MSERIKVLPVRSALRGVHVHHQCPVRVAAHLRALPCPHVAIRSI